ncbi:MAG: Fe-S protein assembly co-chaperone HscB [Proteobacteria bacterium]|nr:Fe-S protein assembly co-chaperone HscB [Pseudomonadota bacterium]MBI3496666.1 Fe-S protein assembly co-chaperone HscB [Pseudomonadota bacterium]
MSAAEDIVRGPEPSVIACWSCRGPTPAAEPFCPTCGAVQPPGQADHFRRLGLPRSFAIDTAEVEGRYFQLQRRLHPDRFATKGSRERALSQSQASSLNAAYETLMDPVRRAGYLLRLQGIEVDAGDGKTIDDRELLMEAMEMREALAEAADAAAVEDALARTQAAVGACRDRLAVAFAAADRALAHRLTLRLKYLSKLQEETEQRRLRFFAAKAG